MENKLIPLSDFVLKQNNIVMEVQSVGIQLHNRASRFNLITNYAQFLKQPLALWMFVPCDENNVPFKKPIEPKYSWGSVELDTQLWAQYQYEKDMYDKAKSRVLFEGLKLVDNWIENKYGEHLIDIDALIAFSIEDLASWHMDIDLTPTAIKQIYGS